VVWRAERKCFAWEFSARATNTLQTFAYETQVFLVCAENMECESNFLQYGILLCAVTKATVLPLNFSAEKSNTVAAGTG
jgi:hypothetical protein